MNATAAHAIKPAPHTPVAPVAPVASDAPGAQSRNQGRHERPADVGSSVRVIAGGRHERRVPAHARAIPAPSRPTVRQVAPVPARLGMQGVGFGLDTRERLIAYGAGGLFTLAAVVAALV